MTNTAIDYTVTFTNEQTGYTLTRPYRARNEEEMRNIAIGVCLAEDFTLFTIKEGEMPRKTRFLIHLYETKYDGVTLVEYFWAYTQEEAEEFAKTCAEAQGAKAYSVLRWPPITPCKTL